MTEKHQCETTLINCFFPAYEQGSDSRWLCPEHLKGQKEWDAFIENKRVADATKREAGAATAGLSLAELQAVTPAQIRALPELIAALKQAQHYFAYHTTSRTGSFALENINKALLKAD